METGRIEFEKIKISDEAFEAAGVMDVNNDGTLDIVSGGYWYEGPNWKKHKICDVHYDGKYYDDFSVLTLDVNADGHMDFITGGWSGGTLVWRENPQGRSEEWKTHEIDRCGNIETTRGWDLDGDGEVEVVPNTPNQPLRFYKLLRDAAGRSTAKFRKIQIQPDGQRSGHGLGCGNLAGNGRMDLIVNKGWWECPPRPLDEPWPFHPDFDLGKMASVPILVADLNGDGLSELIVGNAHGYGLDYWQQRLEAGGKRIWQRHPIDPWFSQYHDLQWADIDNDGQCELITGSRFLAHCGNDKGETDLVGLYIFKWNGESFTKQVVDHGRSAVASGTGIAFALADLDGKGRLDIVAPGKEGLYLFRNLGLEGTKPGR